MTPDTPGIQHYKLETLLHHTAEHPC